MLEPTPKVASLLRPGLTQLSCKLQELCPEALPVRAVRAMGRAMKGSWATRGDLTVARLLWPDAAHPHLAQLLHRVGRSEGRWAVLTWGI